MARWLWLSTIIIVLDLATKAVASSSLTYGVSVPVFPCFNLTLLHNTGAAFSFLANESGWQRWFFILLAVAVSISLIVWLIRLKEQEKWLAIALSLVLGGAIGNLYDRIVHGFVVDFLHFYYGPYHFPAFNIADTAITIGAFMIAIDVFRQGGGEARTDNAPVKSAVQDLKER